MSPIFIILENSVIVYIFRYNSFRKELDFTICIKTTQYNGAKFSVKSKMGEGVTLHNTDQRNCRREYNMTNETTNKKFVDDIYGSEQELVHGISHDMGAPIRSVVQFSQLLQNRLGERLDEKETYWLRLINESGLKVQKMIDAMLV